MNRRFSLASPRAFGALCAGIAFLLHPVGALQAQPQEPAKAAAPTADNAPDLAFGAYQRGLYATALSEAMKRIDANPSDGPAMTLMGELYSQGLDVRRDPTEAARWYKLASDNGERQATFALAMAKLKGDGVPEDRAGATALFEKAAAQGHPGALYNLGVLAIANNGIVSNFAKAAKDFEQAANLGDSDGAYALGLLYRNGSGVEKSDERAAEWIGLAAKENNVAAEVEYAIMLFNGIGVPKDETAAAKLFLKAAARDNPVAQNRVARLLAAGRGLPQDKVEAMKWHLLARTAGIKDPWLDGELNKLSPKEKAEVQAALHNYVGN
ncbi:MAG: tetratricopeptide repeat protein [Methylocella sp.]